MGMSQSQFENFKKSLEKDSEESKKVLSKLIAEFEEQQNKLEYLVQPNHTPSFLGVVNE